MVVIKTFRYSMHTFLLLVSLFYEFSDLTNEMDILCKCILDVYATHKDCPLVTVILMLELDALIRTTSTISLISFQMYWKN